MPNAIEAGAFLLVLGLPGLLTVYLTRQAAPSAETEPEANSTLLTALVIAMTIMALEFWLLSMATLACGSLRIWGGLTLAELASSDPMLAIRDRPAQVASIAATQFVCHLAVFGVLGWFDPVGVRLRRRQARRGFQHTDPWAEAVTIAKGVLDASTIFAVVRLSNGTAYSGTVQSISFRPNGAGHRDIFLQSVERISNEGAKPIEPQGGSIDRSGLVLNTKDVIAVEFAYR